jgi:thioredoxin 1
MAAVEIKDAEFEDKVLKSELPVLVDFWAPWCGPCKMAGPVLDELAKEFEGKAHVVKLNVDENQDNPQTYQVMSIPTTILFKGGKEVGRQVGFAGKKPFEDLIKKGL